MQKKEQLLQSKIKRKLEARGWFVKVVTSNAYFSGFPDIFACHKSYGIRLIEVKLPNMKGSRFTKAQIATFPKLIHNGAGVWILTSDSNHELEKLFKPSNYLYYMLEKL